MVAVGGDFRSYRVVASLGRGGMGQVYLGLDRRASLFAAIKTLYPEYARDEEVSSRFDREADVYRSLRHANIVRLLEDGREDDERFIVLEYVHGAALDKVLSRVTGPLPHRMAAAVFEGACHALFHAHAKGVVHRDIKPANIMIDPEGTVKLLDFGIAQVNDYRVDTDAGVMMGTCFYASPEQNAGDPVDERSDLYSLGLVLFEMLTGRRALQGKNPLDIARRQLQEPLPPVLEAEPSAPPELAAVADRLVLQDRRQRPRAARLLVDELVSLRTRLPGARREALFGGETDAGLEQLKRLFHAQDHGRALALAEDIERSREDLPQLHFLKGKVLAARRVPYLSSQAFLRALELDPDNLDYRLDYALVLRALGWYDQAREQAALVLGRQPKHLLAAALQGVLQEDGPGPQGASGG